MDRINAGTSPEELAAIVSQALVNAGITATLSGGGAVVIYSNNAYESADLDFVTFALNDQIDKALAPLGFSRAGASRHHTHPDTEYSLEFPSGPLAFGETDWVSDEDATTLGTAWGPLRIITATQCVMDRLVPYIHQDDPQSFEQAVMVTRSQRVNWEALREWAHNEGAPDDLIDKLKKRADAD